MKRIQFMVLIFISTCSLVCSQTDQKTLSYYLQNYQYQNALAYIAEQEPTKELLIRKSLCYKALRDYRKSIEILKTLSIEYPSDIQVKSELAVCLEMVGQRQASVGCYDDLMKIDSTNVYFYQQKADVLFQMGKSNEALMMYQDRYQKIALPNTLKRSAQCFDKLQMPDSAMVYYKAAWAENPDDAFSAANLINLCLKNRRVLQAMNYSDIYLERDSSDQQINLLNALSYYSSDLYEEAITRFKKCYEKGDTSLIANRSLGIAFYSMNDSYEAEPFLENAFRQDTTNNNVLYCLAAACNHMAEHAKAIPYYRMLLERTIPPDLTLYLYYEGLASAYDKGARYQEAVDTYLEALGYAGAKQKIDTYYAIAHLYDFFLKDKSKSLEYFALYRDGLVAHIGSLKEKEESDEKELQYFEEKLKELDSYMKEIEKRIEAS